MLSTMPGGGDRCGGEGTIYKSFILTYKSIEECII